MASAEDIMRMIGDLGTRVDGVIQSMQQEDNALRTRLEEVTNVIQQNLGRVEGLVTGIDAQLNHGPLSQVAGWDVS